LAEPAEKYGHYQFDDRIQDFLYNKMTESEAWELLALRDCMSEDFDIVEKWLNEYNMTVHPEARLVYFMRCLIGTADDAHLFEEYEK
jgi:hypothetical protein